MVPQARLPLIRAAPQVHGDGIHHIPPHRQVVPWAARAGVSVVHRADNLVIRSWITIQ